MKREEPYLVELFHSLRAILIMCVRSRENERSQTSGKKQENRQMLAALIGLIHSDTPRSLAPSRTSIDWQVSTIDIVCSTIKLFKFSILMIIKFHRGNEFGSTNDVVRHPRIKNFD